MHKIYLLLKTFKYTKNYEVQLLFYFDNSIPEPFM